MTTWRNPGRDPAVFTAIQEMLGEDTADNTQETTLTAANADGSMVERLEYLQSRILLQAAVATASIYNPLLGFRVTKTEDVNTATSDDLFTLTGKVLITLWTCEVTNALDAAVTDYQITLTTLAGVLLAAGNIASSIVGHIFTLNHDAGDTALSTSTSAVSVAGVGDTQGKMGWLVVGKAGGTDVIKSVRTAGASGDAIVHIVYYWPLETGASLVAAA
jgi:hypothetical protein